MDALSEVLKIVKLKGALFFNAEFSAPWCLASSQSSQIAPLLCPGAGHVIIYHYLADGRAYAQLPNGSRRGLGPGDVVIFPHGDAHVLGNGAGKPVDSLKAFAKNLSDGLKVARYGGGGELTKFVCGYMACDPSLSEVLLAGLPSMFVSISRTIPRDNGWRIRYSSQCVKPEGQEPAAMSFLRSYPKFSSSRRCGVSSRTCRMSRRDGSPEHAIR
jgi:Cupin